MLYSVHISRGFVFVVCLLLFLNFDENFRVRQEL